MDGCSGLWHFLYHKSGMGVRHPWRWKDGAWAVHIDIYSLLLSIDMPDDSALAVLSDL